MELATKITMDVLEGLDYAHHAPLTVEIKGGSKVSAKGLVHRDFKPSNIFLTGSGNNMRAKVADFVLAKAFVTSGLSGHTRTGVYAGTPVFMARQQITNFKYAKPEVDVWAAAASYYYMLTGDYPKDFAKGSDAFSVALNSNAVPIRKRNKNIPEKLAKVIDTALKEKPEIPIKSAAELRDAIKCSL